MASCFTSFVLLLRSALLLPLACSTLVAAGAQVTSVSATNPDGHYHGGDTLTLTVTWDRPVTVSGNPTLELATAPTPRLATCTAGGGSDTLHFVLALADNDHALDLDYSTSTALDLAGGTILDADGESADLALPAPGSSGSLAANKDLAVGLIPDQVVWNDDADGDLGQAVALSGDLCAIAAEEAIRVYRRTAGRWSHTATIPLAPDDHVSDLAIADGRIVAGVPSWEASGAVFVYRHQQGDWVASAPLVPPGPDYRNSVGRQVAVSGETIAFSSFTNIWNHSRDNAVHIYELVSDSWVHQASFFGYYYGGNHNYGASLALCGDRLLVGSPDQEDRYALRRMGTVFLYARDADGWSLTGRLRPPEPHEDQCFGFALATSGDRLAVYDDSAAVTIYTYAGGFWRQSARIELGSPRGFAAYGSGPPDGLALSGDTLLVSYAGETRRFVHTDGAWHATTAPGTGHPTLAGAGYPLSLEGDTLVADHSTYDADTATRQGGVCFFSLPDTHPPQVIQATSRSADRIYGPGESIDIDLVFDEAVRLATDASHEIKLDSGARLTLDPAAHPTASTVVRLRYLVADGERSPDLAITDLAPAAGAGLVDRAGNPVATSIPPAANLDRRHAIVVDAVPHVCSVSATADDGTYTAGDALNITVTFDRAVVVSGEPQLLLDAGVPATASYSSGSGSATLSFTYTVLTGHATPDLGVIDAAALSAADGAITAAGLEADLRLPPPGQPGSLRANTDLVIDTLTPQDYIGSYRNAMGAAVAVCGDVAAAGDPAYNQVTIYERRDGTWTQKQVVSGEWFGIDAGLGGTLAISGSTIAIGQSPAYGAGSNTVVVMRREETGWIPAESLTGGPSFGAAIALLGDTLAIGEPAYDDDPDNDHYEDDHGAVHVYERDNGSWYHQQRLTGAADTQLGTSLALSGDRLAVGAAGDGTVMVYRFDDWQREWIMEQTLTCPTDTLGHSVALSGGRLLAGSPASNRVWTYRRDESWQADGCITPPATAAGFGTAVALSGEVAVIGAPSATVPGRGRSGLSMVYRLREDGWTPVSTISPPLELDRAAFGASVDLSRDTVITGAPDPDRDNQPGVRFATIASLPKGGLACIGSPTPDGVYGPGESIDLSLVFDDSISGVTADLTTELDSGAILTGASLSSLGDVLRVRYTVAVGEESPDLAGTALSGTTFSDGCGEPIDLAVPAGHDLAATRSIVVTGGVRVNTVRSASPDGVYRAGETVTIAVEFTAPVEVSGEPTLALDLDADRAARYSSGSGSDTLTFTYTVQPGDWTQDLGLANSHALSGALSAAEASVCTLVPQPGSPRSLRGTAELQLDGDLVQKLLPEEERDSGFGWAIAISGDTMAVGSRDIRVFSRDGGAWTQQCRLAPEYGQPDRGLGEAVALQGDRLASVASSMHAGPQVFIYERAAGTWSLADTIALPYAKTSYPGPSFSLALSGETLAVGLPYEPSGPGRTQGAVYVYAHRGGTWIREARLLDSQQNGNYHGSSLALCGDLLVVRPGVVTYGHSTGDVFHRRDGNWSRVDVLPPSWRDDRDELGQGLAIGHGRIFSGDSEAPDLVDTSIHPGRLDILTHDHIGWYREAALLAPQPLDRGYFAHNLAYQGDLLVAASNSGGMRAPRANTALLYRPSASGWAFAGERLPVDTAASDDYAQALAVAGSTLACGAPEQERYVNGRRNTGAVYVYTVDDRAAPRLVSVASPAADAAYGPGDTLDLALVFDEAVTLSGGDLLVSLNSGGTMRIAPADPPASTAVLRGTYTIAEDEHTPDLGCTGFALAPGASLRDAAGHDAVLAPPDGDLAARRQIALPDACHVQSVDSPLADGRYGAGAVIDIRVLFSAPVVVSGEPRLRLAMRPEARLARYVGGSGSDELRFAYVVRVGDHSPDLDYTDAAALVLDAAELHAADGRPTHCQLPQPGSHASLAGGSELIIGPSRTHTAQPDSAEDDSLGSLVAVGGAWAAAGAPGAGAESHGRVNLYRLQGGNWRRERVLGPDDGSAFHGFGSALAIDEGTLLVGAPRTDDGETDSVGAAYVFVYADGAWTQQARLAAPSPSEWDYFGTELALSGDTAAIHASGSDSVHIYTRDGPSWSLEQTLATSGSTLALAGDLLLIGLPSADYRDRGYARLYAREGATWNQVVTWPATEPADDARFGSAVALAEGLAVVGAPRMISDPGRPLPGGAVHIYAAGAEGWTEVATLTCDADTDAFGSALALHDGMVLVGDPAAPDATGRMTGAVSLHVPGASGWAPAETFHATADDGPFGQNLALTTGWAIVGRPESDRNGRNAGAVDFIPLDSRPEPRLVALATTTPDGSYRDGEAIDLSLVFDEPVTLAGGPLEIALDSGATVAITPAEREWPRTVVDATYTVAFGERSDDLHATTIALGSTASLLDGSGLAAQLDLPPERNLDAHHDIVVRMIHDRAVHLSFGMAGALMLQGLQRGETVYSGEAATHLLDGELQAGESVDHGTDKTEDLLLHIGTVPDGPG